jgi:hypothetical protein
MEKIMNITYAGRKRVLASSLLPPLKKGISFLGKRYFVLKYKYFICCFTRQSWVILVSTQLFCAYPSVILVSTLLFWSQLRYFIFRWGISFCCPEYTCTFFISGEAGDLNAGISFPLLVGPISKISFPLLVGLISKIGRLENRALNIHSKRFTRVYKIPP